MRLDDLDYIRLVVADFKKKQQDSERPLLATFTRKSIRQQCINVLDERKSIGENIEANILHAFFGVPPKGQDLRTLIEFYPLDKFRPLENLMRGRIQTGDWANVELLAWLIDFKHRPFSFGKDILLGEEELAILDKIKPGKTGSSNTKNGNTGNSETSSDGRKPNRNIRRIKVAAGFLLGVTLVGASAIWQDRAEKQRFYGNVTGCMYWTGDHYEKIPCNENNGDQLVLPLNEEKLKAFKKITRPDTIRAWSIGTVHYFKKNNKYEFFTTGGKHPVETTRSLRKLSHYIYDSVLCNSIKLSEIVKYSQTGNKPITDN